MLIQTNYYSYQNPNKYTLKANTSSDINNKRFLQSPSEVSFGAKHKSSSVGKKVAIGSLIAIGVLIAADVVFNKGKNLKTLQKKFVGLFSKKPKSQKMACAIPEKNTKIVSDCTPPTAKVKPAKVANPTNSTVKIKETRNPKGKITSIEKFEYDEAGKITKFTVESPQRGTSATYNYVTGEYTVEGARYKVKNAAGEVVEEIRTISYPVEKIDPQNINFTQQSMGENYRALVESFREKGWQGQPVDVIRTKNGQYISMDNRRIAAAREAGIDVHAIIHEIDEPLTSGKCAQYRIKDPKTKDSFEPVTWGEAIYNRLFQNGLTTPNGTVDIVAAHNIPSIVPDPLLEIRKSTLFDLYFSGQKPYSSFYF